RLLQVFIPFLSTLPARGATGPCRRGRIRLHISIHAPREGSDAAASGADGHRLPHFYPRSPRGERPVRPVGMAILPLLLPTLPARGATGAAGRNGDIAVISIHAPREGSDDV